MRDDGPGVSPEERARLTERFFRVLGSGQTGSGLGLMIVQRIIDDHGGEIELSSKLAEGTCFKIRLPRSERRIRMLKNVSEVCQLPIIASGGAGKMEDFTEVFTETNVTGALAASIFHFNEIKISDLKENLKLNKIAIR